MNAASGKISAVSGTGVAGDQGDGGPPATAELNQPVGVAVGSPGNVYVADTLNNVVREIVPNVTGQDVTTTPAQLSIAADSETKFYGQSFSFSGNEFTTSASLQR